MEPVVEPLDSAGHDVMVVGLPCGNADATLEKYADAVRAVLPDDLTQVVLVGDSFGVRPIATDWRTSPDLPGPSHNGRMHPPRFMS